MALKDTIRKFQIPISLLDDLITAFLMDLEKNRYATFAELLAYCRYSANPIGRIILHLFDYRSERLFAYSDAICTALQLTNFWQDVAVDAEKNRIYIPAEYLTKYGVNEEQILKQKHLVQFSEMMQELIARTRNLFSNGKPLLVYVRAPLKWELYLIIAGGLRILKKIEQHKDQILFRRPVLNKWDWVSLLFTQPFNMSYQLS